MSAAAAHRADAKVLARGAVTNFLGYFGRISRALAFLLIAWLFGAEMLGLFLLAWAATDFVRRFVGFGQEQAVVYHLSRALSDGDDEQTARLIGSSLLVVFAASILGTAALWLGRDIIAERLFSEPRLVVALKAFVFILPAHGIGTVLLAATRARKVMRYEVLTRSFIEPFVALLGALVAWWTDTGLLGLAVGQAAAVWVGTLTAVIFYHRLYPLRPLGRALMRPAETVRLVRYGTPVALTDIVFQGVARIDLFLVGYFLDTAAAGVYGIVLEIANLAKYVRLALEPIFAPLVVEQHHRAERDRLQYTYRNATRWALLVNLAIFGIAALAGGTILRVYGNDFAAGSTALAILVCGHVISGAFGLSEMLLLMVGRPTLRLGDMALLLGLIGVLDYTFIQFWGITGAAIGTASATVCVVFLQVFQVRRSTGVHPLRRALLKPVIACAAALILAWIIPLWHLPMDAENILRAILFVGFYLAILVQLGMEEEERRFGSWVKRRIGRRIAPASAQR